MDSEVQFLSALNIKSFLNMVTCAGIKVIPSDTAEFCMVLFRECSFLQKNVLWLKVLSRGRMFATRRTEISPASHKSEQLFKRTRSCLTGRGKNHKYDECWEKTYIYGLYVPPQIYIWNICV